MAIISMLPSGLRDPNKSFTETTISLDSNKWVEDSGIFKYTEIVDGITDNDVLDYKSSSSVIGDDELYVLSNMTDFTYGINHVIFSCSIKPTININITLYPISMGIKDLYQELNRLKKIINTATSSNTPNTIVLRDSSGEIIGPVRTSTNATFSTNDSYGRNISETYAPIESPTFLGTPTVPNPDVSKDGYERVIPNISYVNSKINTEISKIDFMNYIGTLGVDGDISTLPREGVRKGDSYKIITAGTYAEYSCKLGDILIAKRTGVAERTKDYWSLIPCGDETSLIRYSSNVSEVNISNSYASGRITLGEASTKQITDTVKNTSDLITSSAVFTELNNIKAIVEYDHSTIPLIGTVIAQDDISITTFSPGLISVERITPNDNYTDITINDITLDATLSNGDQIIRSKTTQYDNVKIGEWYKFTSTNDVIRLSDDDQIKLANLYLSSRNISATGLNIEIKYPINELATYVLNSYNAPQRMLMSLIDGKDLYIKTK